jgi:hypothetical protein
MGNCPILKSLFSKPDFNSFHDEKINPPSYLSIDLIPAGDEIDI